MFIRGFGWEIEDGLIRLWESTLYRKGPLVLEELKRAIGDQHFYHFLNVLNRQQIKTTSEALLALKNTVSKEAEALLRTSLQQ